MADTYFHVSGIPALSADALVAMNLRLKRAVAQTRGGDQDKVVVDQVTSGVTYSYTRTSVAGAAAGNVTVNGIATTNTLVAVVGIKDADQTTHDFTSEFVICAANTIGNAGGTATTGYHLVVVYY